MYNRHYTFGTNRKTVQILKRDFRALPKKFQRSAKVISFLPQIYVDVIERPALDLSHLVANILEVQILKAYIPCDQSTGHKYQPILMAIGANVLSGVFRPTKDLHFQNRILQVKICVLLNPLV